jgi:hypothetical protein
MASKISYIYDYINKLCRTKAEVILKNENPNVHGTEQEEAIHRKYERLKLGGGLPKVVQLTNCSFGVVK